PCAELLSLAARQPVLGWSAGHHPRHLGAAHRGRGRRGRPPGALDVCHGPPRGGGPGAGLPDAAVATRVGPAAGGGRPPTAGAAAVRGWWRGAGRERRGGRGGARGLTGWRGLCEPFVNALAAHFQFAMPPFQPENPPVDNWQTSAWMRRSPGLGGLPAAGAEDE